jgi:hypothetical protein
MKLISGKSKTLFVSMAFCLAMPHMKAQNVAKAGLVLTHLSKEEDDGERADKSMNCGGVERWNVKVLIDTAAHSVNYVADTMTVPQMDTLVVPAPNANAPRNGAIEYMAIASKCFITSKRVESDNDYHLVIGTGLSAMIAEIPDPSCSAAASSTHVNEYIQARNFVDTHIASGNVYTVTIPAVIVTGIGFVDPPHGQAGAAPNNLELHPVINIRFLNPADGIEDLSKTLNVTVGPNPFTVSTEFQLNSKLNNLEKVTITLFDMLGEEIQTTAVPVIGNSQIDYVLPKGDLKAGIYLYRFRNNGNILYEGRIVVQ